MLINRGGTKLLRVASDKEVFSMRNLVLLMALAGLGWGQHTTDNPGSSPEIQKRAKHKGSVARDIGGGTGNIAASPIKGAGSVAKGTAKGAADVATLHPIGGAEAVAGGAAKGGKDVAVGSAKGAGKITRGVGRAFKKIF